MEAEAFPNTRKDVSNLKDTAVTAAKELRDTASEHLDKAKTHVSELKSTAVEAAKDLKSTAAVHVDKAKTHVSELKTTAVEAAKDLKSTAAVHVEKAKGHLRELATHARAEGADQLVEVRGKFEDLTKAARDYVTSRPLACVGVALAAGFLLGLTRRR